ncbi:MAG: cbb3-type cytochrome c oxidase subunit 3 [Ignavibacteriaceae bacterium]|nr:cbb3-type cytochrome c oxidase subunit 3 [Ignavibacteriaceae bacterium]
MYKEVLQSIKGVEVFAIISLFLFILLFVVIVFRTVKLDKKYLNKMAQLPLDSENNSQNLKGE